MSTDPPFTEGTRQALTAEFVTRRAVDTDAGPVRRLLVASGDDHVALFVPAYAGTVAGLRTGTTYRFAAVLGCAPVRRRPAPNGVPGECPDCGGPVRAGQAVDAHPGVREAVAHLDIDHEFGLVDDRTRVEPADPESHRRPTSEPPPERGPEAVCRRCGAVVDAAGELEGEP